MQTDMVLEASVYGQLLVQFGSAVGTSGCMSIPIEVLVGVGSSSLMIKLSQGIWVSLLNEKPQQHREASGAIRGGADGQGAGIDVAAVMGEALSETPIRLRIRRLFTP
jgi:hypothetical protein